MTPAEAKAITLEVWRALAENGSLQHKSELPKELFAKIYFLYSGCPLCELFCKDVESGNKCHGCPLFEAGIGCNTATESEEREKWDPYTRWEESDAYPLGVDERAHAAGQIVEAVEKWEVSS